MELALYQLYECFRLDLELYNIINVAEGYYTCISRQSNHRTRFFLTHGKLSLFMQLISLHEMSFPTENPYLRAVSSRDVFATLGESVTLEFAVALTSNGVTSNNDRVNFTFTNSNGVLTVTHLNFQTSNQDYPQNFVYTIERVNRSHVGVYTAEAASMFVHQLVFV